MIAYCFVPDHVHLVIEGQTDSSDCRRFIARGKHYSGFHYARTFGARRVEDYPFLGSKVYTVSHLLEAVAR